MTHRASLGCGCFVLLFLLSSPGSSQRTGLQTGAGGGGPESPSVIATWQAHGANDWVGPLGSVPPAPREPAGTLLLDLLVLWRGSPGWFDQNHWEIGAGGSDGVHRVVSGGRVPKLELRFDPNGDTVTILVEGTAIPLNGANVLLLDNVDFEIRVFGTVNVTSTLPPLSQGEPIAELIRRSPQLSEFVGLPGASPRGGP